MLIECPSGVDRYFSTLLESGVALYVKYSNIFSNLGKIDHVLFQVCSKVIQLYNSFSGFFSILESLQGTE